MKTLAELDCELGNMPFKGLASSAQVETLDDLKAQILRAYPSSKMGRQKFIANTGEQYVEIAARGIARNREYDIHQVKKIVARSMSMLFCNYSRNRTGPGFTLYWRVEPEEDVSPTLLVEHFDDNGPDRDYMTDRRCYADRDWVGIGMYMRLLISDKPELPEI